MKMIGQEYPGVDMKSAPFANLLNRIAQRRANIAVAQKGLAAVGDHGEEVGATGLLCAAIRGPVLILAVAGSHCVSEFLTLFLLFCPTRPRKIITAC